MAEGGKSEGSKNSKCRQGISASRVVRRNLSKKVGFTGAGADGARLRYIQRTKLSKNSWLGWKSWDMRGGRLRFWQEWKG
jgi:hypothetical protein